MLLKKILVRDLSGYLEWSSKYLDEHSALIAHLDCFDIMIHPEDLAGPHEKLFEELFAELRKDFIDED